MSESTQFSGQLSYAAYANFVKSSQVARLAGLGIVTETIFDRVSLFRYSQLNFIQANHSG